MLLQEILNEMPQFKDQDLKLGAISANFDNYSVQEFKNGYRVLAQKPQGQDTVIVGLSNDEMVGIVGLIRKDDPETIKTIVALEFYGITDLGEAGEHPALQVELVLATDDSIGFGYGYLLYKSILNNGYTIVSDETQYKGGKALWQKIVRKAASDLHNVYIMQNGKYMRDAAGKPIVYDGSNISDDTIWGKPGSQKHADTLLVAMNTSR